MIGQEIKRGRPALPDYLKQSKEEKRRKASLRRKKTMIEKTCEYCQVEYTASSWEKTRRFCSVSCASKKRDTYGVVRKIKKDENESMMWRVYWKYKIPIMEAELRGVKKKSRPHGKDLEDYMICSHKMLHDTFHNKRSEVRRIELPLELQSHQEANLTHSKDI